MVQGCILARYFQIGPEPTILRAQVQNLLNPLFWAERYVLESGNGESSKSNVLHEGGRTWLHKFCKRPIQF